MCLKRLHDWRSLAYVTGSSYDITNEAYIYAFIYMGLFGSFTLAHGDVCGDDVTLQVCTQARGFVVTQRKSSIQDRTEPCRH